MRYRVWWEDEFNDYDEAERERRAWVVPDRHGILFPEHAAPCEDVEDAAEQYADYFHSNRDGWENTWPVNFVVHDGARYHLVTVDREYDPTFSAWRPVPLPIATHPAEPDTERG